MSDVGFQAQAWWTSSDPKAFEKAHENFQSRRCGNCKDDISRGMGHDRRRWLCTNCLPGFDAHARTVQEARRAREREEARTRGPGAVVAALAPAELPESLPPDPPESGVFLEGEEDPPGWGDGWDDAEGYR